MSIRLTKNEIGDYDGKTKSVLLLTNGSTDADHSKGHEALIKKHNKSLKGYRNFNVGMGAVGVGLTAMNARGLVKAKKEYSALKNNTEKAKEYYAKSNAKIPFNQWKKERMKILKKIIIISGVGTTVGATGSIYNARSAYKTNKSVKYNREKFGLSESFDLLESLYKENTLEDELL